MSNRGLIIALFALVISGNVHSAVISGKFLLATLESDDPQMKLQAEGFVIGVTDTITSKALSRYCFKLEKGLGAADVISAVRLYLKTHPEDLKYAASSQVAKALFEAFPESTCISPDGAYINLLVIFLWRRMCPLWPKSYGGVDKF